jgi:hypothetical protein
MARRRVATIGQASGAEVPFVELAGWPLKADEEVGDSGCVLVRLAGEVKPGYPGGLERDYAVMSSLVCNYLAD